MTDYYDTTKYSQQDAEKHDLAGEFKAKITGCKLVSNQKTGDDQFLVTFDIDGSLHFERFTLNEKFGWLFDKFLKDLGLGYSERKGFFPNMITGRYCEIELEQKGEYLRLKSARPVVSTPDPTPARDNDIPF